MANLWNWVWSPLIFSRVKVSWPRNFHDWHYILVEEISTATESPLTTQSQPTVITNNTQFAPQQRRVPTPSRLSSPSPAKRPRTSSLSENFSPKTPNLHGGLNLEMLNYPISQLNDIKSKFFNNRNALKNKSNWMFYLVFKFVIE